MSKENMTKNLTLDEIGESIKEEIGYARHLELNGKKSADSVLYFFIQGFKKAEQLKLSDKEEIARKWWKVGLVEAGATDEDDFDKYFDDNHKSNI